jgi:hypothetical protein
VYIVADVAKPPSWNQIRSNAAAFAARWEDATEENAEAQTFWNEFFAIFGVDRRRVATFERRAKRTSTTGRGRIDLFWAGTLIAEHKSLGNDLMAAEDQAFDYLDSIEQEQLPEYAVASDFRHIRITSITDGDSVTFDLSDLPKEIDRFGFIAGYAKRDFSPEAEEAANIEAARLMARLYEALSQHGYEGHEASVLMTRLLFLLFGDDTGMWEKGLFHEFVAARTSEDGTDLGPQLALLFQVLNTDEPRPAALDELLTRFPWVNGGLFADRLNIPTFNKSMRIALLDCCGFDWGAISPAVFGSLFQAVKSKEARRELGEHYTTETNILKVIRPLFLDELRADFEAARKSKNRLVRLQDHLAELRLLDPACGCGNFLVVAYREMRRLELDILLALRELSGSGEMRLDATLNIKVGLEQFSGIEIEEWPARIAETAMFLVDHQMNLELAAEFGLAPDRLPIRHEANIHIGNAARVEWSEVIEISDDLLILGNPPFHGMSLMNAEQQEDNRLAFSEIDSEGLRTGRLDYVAVWYAKAFKTLAGTKARAAFVSTSSLTQGEQARTMQPLMRRAGYKIDFAHRTFRWTSEAPSAAAVHVVVVGFSAEDLKIKRRLFDYPTITSDPVEVTATYINSYLVDWSGEIPKKRRRPLLAGLPIATQGSKPADGGNLIVEPDEYEEVASDEIAVKYLRPYRGAREMLHDLDRWCLWLVDATPSDLSNSEVIRARLEKVAEMRRKSPTESVREAAETPHLFTQNRQPERRYAVLPQTSSENRDYIPGGFFEPNVVVSNALYMWRDAPLWLFGYLQSAAFMAWTRTFSGRLKSDFQIAPDLIYSTFPFIKPSAQKKTQIESLTQAMLDTRDEWPEESLATLYGANSMPGNLRKAHRDLDRAIDGLYRLTRPTEGARLRALLARYAKLTED